MRVCREASRPSAAARTATVFPDPTSPVSTPRPRAEISQRSRATASLCAAEPNRPGTGMAAVNGMMVKPQCDCRVSIIGFSVLSAAVSGGDRGGDQGDVAAVEAAESLPQVHVDGGPPADHRDRLAGVDAAAGGDDAAEAGLVQEMAVPGDQGDRGVVGGYPGGGVFQQAGELGGGHGQGAHCRASCSSCPVPPPCRVPSPPAMLDSRSRSPPAAAACPA